MISVASTANTVRSRKPGSLQSKGNVTTRRNDTTTVGVARQVIKMKYFNPKGKPQPIGALLASLGATITLIIAAAIPITLKSSGAYSTKEHVVYIGMTTFIGTIGTAFIMSQVQAQLLLHEIDGKADTDRIKNLWQVILHIGSLKEYFKFRVIVITIIYLLTSQITTAFVTGLAPDLTTRLSLYSPKISYGQSSCCRTRPLWEVEIDGREYYWDLGNGSAFFIPANAGGCPTRFATVLAGNVNSVNPDVFAYADGGVKVIGSAIGTPPSIYSSQPNIAPDFNTLLDMYGWSVVSTTQCVPVMRTNPIACRRGGTITLGSSQMNLTSIDGRCTHNAEFPFYNPLTDNTMASKMCAYGEVGQGTIIMDAGGSHVKCLASFLSD